MVSIRDGRSHWGQKHAWSSVPLIKFRVTLNDGGQKNYFRRRKLTGHVIKKLYITDRGRHW